MNNPTTRSDRYKSFMERWRQEIASRTVRRLNTLIVGINKELCEPLGVPSDMLDAVTQRAKLGVSSRGVGRPAFRFNGTPTKTVYSNRAEPVLSKQRFSTVKPSEPPAFLQAFALLQSGLVHMGFRGTEFLESGFVFSPYIPLYSTEILTSKDFRPNKATTQRPSYGFMLAFDLLKPNNTECPPESSSNLVEDMLGYLRDNSPTPPPQTVRFEDFLFDWRKRYGK